MGRMTELVKVMGRGEQVVSEVFVVVFLMSRDAAS